MQVEVKLEKLLHINDTKGIVLEICVSNVCIRKYIACYFTEKTVCLANKLDLKLSLILELEILNFRQVFEESFYSINC